jgi:hypothetical protein
LNDLEKYRILLNCNKLTNNWNYPYGITESKSKALILNSQHRDSFFNPKPESAETTLTLFMLGNIDKWKQNDLLHNQVPRNEKNSNWNKSFFDMMRGDDLGQENVGVDPLWSELFKNNKMIHEIDFSKSWLLFEFQIMNKSFHSFNGARFENLSFLDLKKIDNWGQFDAILIIPNTRQIIFFEAKLSSDISRSTKNYFYINQVIRNLESIFLLTNHKDSLYKEWDFKYVFICPEKVLRYKSTYYSYFLNDVENHISIYEDILNNEYKENKNKQEYFDKFKDNFVENFKDYVILLNWGQLGEVLKKNNQNFFKDYFNKLKKSFNSGQVDCIKSRFSNAGIEI